MDESAWAALAGFLVVMGMFVVILIIAWAVTVIDRHQQRRKGGR